MSTGGATLAVLFTGWAGQHVINYTACNWSTRVKREGRGESLARGREGERELTSSPRGDIKQWQGSHEDYYWSKSAHEMTNYTPGVLGTPGGQRLDIKQQW